MCSRSSARPSSSPPRPSGRSRRKRPGPAPRADAGRLVDDEAEVGPPPWHSALASPFAERAHSFIGRRSTRTGSALAGLSRNAPDRPGHDSFVSFFAGRWLKADGLGQAVLLAHLVQSACRTRRRGRGLDAGRSLRQGVDHPHQVVVGASDSCTVPGRRMRERHVRVVGSL